MASTVHRGGLRLRDLPTDACMGREQFWQRDQTRSRDGSVNCNWELRFYRRNLVLPVDGSATIPEGALYLLRAGARDCRNGTDQQPCPRRH